MSIKLESWYTLKDTQVADNQLIIRFVPDFFSFDIVDPVITIVISKPDNLQSALEALAVFSKDIVNDMSTNSTSLQLWGEYDEQPTVINGGSVLYQRSQYSQDELLSIIAAMEKNTHGLHGENIQLRKQLSDIEDFAKKLLYNANAKKSLTTRSTESIDSQIDVLERILNRINTSKTAA